MAVLKKLGCHLIKMFIGCLLFADDLAILAPSRSALQKMIDICNVYCEDLCLQFNTKESKVMVFGKSFKDRVAPLTLAGSAIDFVNEGKYLGTHFL